MQALSRRMLTAAAHAGKYLNKESRLEIADFIRRKGFCGRDGQEDLYYAVFALACLRILRQHTPYSKCWKFVRSFGLGENLDFVHLVCLARLRAGFPMLGKTRRAFFQALALKQREKIICEANSADKHGSQKFSKQSEDPDPSGQSLETAYDAFLMMLACEDLGREFPLNKTWPVQPSDPTPNVAAAVVLNGRRDEEAIQLLMGRHCASGGFCAGSSVAVPDLLSTGVALFALRTLDANLDEIRESCLEFVESLWRDSGGFAGHAADEFEDCEYTFYGLLSIGCLME